MAEQAQPEAQVLTPEQQAVGVVHQAAAPLVQRELASDHHTKETSHVIISVNGQQNDAVFKKVFQFLTNVLPHGIIRVVNINPIGRTNLHCIELRPLRRDTFIGIHQALIQPAVAAYLGVPIYDQPIHGDIRATLVTVHLKPRFGTSLDTVDLAQFRIPGNFNVIGYEKGQYQVIAYVLGPQHALNLYNSLADTCMIAGNAWAISLPIETFDAYVGLDMAHLKVKLEIQASSVPAELVQEALMRKEIHCRVFPLDTARSNISVFIVYATSGMAYDRLLALVNKPATISNRTAKFMKWLTKDQWFEENTKLRASIAARQKRDQAVAF
jgi:hypothetical protein